MQGAALPPAAGDERRRYIRTVVIVSLAVGDECRRYGVPALPRTVVGVSPAAGDKPQPYIRTVALPPAAGDECRRCRRPVGDEGRPYRGRRCRRLSVFVLLFGNFEAHD